MLAWFVRSSTPLFKRCILQEKLAKNGYQMATGKQFGIVSFQLAQMDSRSLYSSGKGFFRLE